MSTKDSESPVTRRDAIGRFGALGALFLLGCGGQTGASGADGGAAGTDGGPSPDGGSNDGGTMADGGSPGSCVLIPQETQGPYPLLAILSNSAMVRRDITEGRTGIPMTLTIKLVNANNGCAPISNAAVYIWHTDKDGVYSGYSQPGANTVGQTFMRGIQVTDGNGEVTFATIYPGWYSGRITHIHFQVYLNDNRAVTATATSQIAFPPAVTTAAYNSALYSAHGQNTSVGSFAQDNVFSDGTQYQLATITGDTTGYTATLTVGVAA